jgi:hypothetical protein
MENQLILAAISSYVIEYLKTSRWFPLLSYFHTPGYKALFSAFVAALATFGIHYTFESATRHLILTIPTGPEVIHGLWDFSKQFMLQHGSYKLLIKPESKEDLGIR